MRPLKPFGSDALSTNLEKRYSPDQPRDEKGRFGSPGTSEKDTFGLIEDLHSVGPDKPAGYLPHNELEQYGDSPKEAKAEAEKAGLQTYQAPSGMVTGGALYVYHEGALGKLLSANSDVLDKAGLSTKPQTFVKQIATKWYSEGDASKVIAKAFGR